MLRVLHIIPAAFNYFDDIRGEAFVLIDELNKLGIENEAITIQFGAARPPDIPRQNMGSKKDGGVGATKPSSDPSKRRYVGTAPLQKIMESFGEFDIIHVHCPLFGAARKIIRWKKSHPAQPLILTYYRRVRTPDFLSLFIVAYNMLYLPKLFAIADTITAFVLSIIPSGLARKNDRLLEINDEPEFFGTDVTNDEKGQQLSDDQRLAMKYAMVYNTLAA